MSRFDAIPAVTDSHPPNQPRCRSYYALCFALSPKTDEFNC